MSHKTSTPHSYIHTHTQNFLQCELMATAFDVKVKKLIKRARRERLIWENAIVRRNLHPDLIES